MARAAETRLRGLLRQLQPVDIVSPLCTQLAAVIASADVVIRGAKIVDGTGAQPFHGDLAVVDGRIVFAGPGAFTGKGAQEIDGKGKVLAPGFLDIHTHFDPQLCWDGRADPSLKHGVTTVVTGNCSLSLAPVTSRRESERIVGMFQRIEDIRQQTFEAAVPFERWSDFRGWLDFIQPGLKVNVGALIGHSVIRLHVMGEDAQKRAATPEEIEAMCCIVSDAMAAGAIGVSTSYADLDENMKPVPSRWADLDEKVALARAMGKSGRGVWQAVPELTPDGTVRSVRELAEISRLAGVPVSFQPVLTMPMDPTRTDITQVLEEEAASGARVFGQVTPRDFNVNMRLNETALFLMGIKPWERIMAMPPQERLEHFADPAQQPELVASFKKRAVWSPLSFLTVGDVQCEENQRYRGRSLKAIAEEEGKEMGQVLLDISILDGLNAEFRIEGVLNADKAAVAKMLEHPLLHVGASDAGAHITQFCGTGDTTYLLQHVVRAGRLPLELAVHRMTGELAREWGIADRGTLEQGKAADLVLFDLEALELGNMEYVRDVPGGAARYTRHAKGFEAVFVNGIQVLEKDEYTAAAACGRVV